MDNLVSVVVTCYNHENYIKECLESIFKQSYQNIELFIIDDGSTDSSRTVIEDTIKSSPFTKTQYIYQENQGLVAARNHGLNLISGEFFVFVDSDDSLAENYISETLQTALNQGADIVYTRMLNLATQDIVLEARPFKLVDFYIGNYIHAASMVRTSILQGTRYDDYLNYKKLEDYDFFFNLIVNHQAKPVVCEGTHLNYRILGNSMSDRENMRKYYDIYLYILKKYWNQYPEEARTALEWHNNRLLAMNPNTRVDNQWVTIYFMLDGQYCEENTFTHPIRHADSISFTVPEKVEAIRVDLSEVESFYKKVVLLNNESQVEVLSQGTNGHQIGEGYLFTTTDPQIYYDLQNQASLSYTLNYEMMELSDTSSEDYIANVLSQSIEELKTEVEHLKDYRYQFSMAQAEKNRYKKELEEMVVRYNSVVHSRRWIIPTKIIDFFRRRK